MDNNQLKHRQSNKPRHTSQTEHYSTSSSSSSSKWQQIVVGASSAAGTTAAIISEESMKCLKYCLYWLQYAIKHIEHQMALIKSYMVSVATQRSHRITTGSSSVLSNIKKDIVSTLRKVVDVITKYAGASLPSQARQSVRGFILNLPERWSLMSDIRSTATSPAESPLLMPMSSPSSVGPSTPDHNRQEEAAIQLLTFGQESIEMLNSVNQIFSDTVDRAELWIDRLKRVPGIQQINSLTEEDDVRLPPIRHLNLNQE
ncbi:hypothetical protein G6F46_000337 [Rhizopus delemar]|nr:hypothetical protein G6F55_000741 [Rhizopus delemar]KAG1552668.1 hypothetical protein G6F51_001082 [Rhizopus arrhizus]KAG1505440.1 hypothetical protein G6F54_000298 [Rhizopus delemar]KAG1518626.1 hypothetical protein G6F53_000444 [Rhizopus delemar]KAG1525274.1 hypothetical protein G6F52_003473 [Rhizopus delemar]